jgi:ribosomal protein S18 acetylase RimI-like enzyme
MPWRRALKSDIDALRVFLARREEYCAGFTGRIVKHGELRLPPFLRGGVWIETESEAAPPESALLCHPTGIAFPVLAGDTASDPGLKRSTAGWKPAQALGLASHVARYSSALGLAARVSVNYRLMSRLGISSPEPPASPPRGVLIRRALSSDLDALLPLQEAYEREEVLTSIHSYDEAACRASLARSIERQIVYLAEEGGTVVAKAATNARGLAVDQIGGVYTLPSRRGRGLARALVSALLRQIESEGRAAVLFVKPHNAPAFSLYRGLGFVELDDYRVDYY